jgi:hypothetical protein
VLEVPWTLITKVPELPAQQNISALVSGAFPKVMGEVFLAMILRITPMLEVTAVPQINAIGSVGVFFM